MFTNMHSEWGMNYNLFLLVSSAYLLLGVGKWCNNCFIYGKYSSQRDENIEKKSSMVYLSVDVLV